MKYKRIIIMVIAVFIFGVASVCANDVNDTIMASEDTGQIKLSASNEIAGDNLQISEENNTLLQTNNKEIMGSKGDSGVLGASSGSYSDLAGEINHGGNVKLERDYYIGGGDTIVISVDNSVIDGNGAVIDLNGTNTQPFRVTASDVLFKNLTIKNILNNINVVATGAIYFETGGTGSVENCNFINNTAYSGVAIYFETGRTGIVENCNFTANTANCDGGAVYFSSSGSVENCNFTDNKASGYGGAIWMNTGTVTNCNFTDNNASGYGGAIRMGSGTVTNCNFTGNNATSGSAIYFHSISDTKMVSNSIFLNNRANARDLEVTKNENAITFTFTGDDNLLNAIYSNNNAEVTFTNVFYWGAKGISNTGTSTLARSNKEAGQNITLEIYDYYDGSLVGNITLPTDDNGQAEYDLSKINRGKYRYNAYHREDSYYTYAKKNGIFTTGVGDFNILQRYINGADANSVLTLNRSYIFTIDLDENLTDGIVIDKPITINGNGYTINALQKARIFQVTTGNVVLNNITFTNATTLGNGGAVYFNSSGSVEHCNFTDNQASGDGGAIWMSSGSVENCNFTVNNATLGGAVYFNDTGDVANCNFANNNATLGGAIAFGSAGSKGDVVNCTFIDNSAMYGGAILWNKSGGKVSGCIFVNNSADNAIIYFDNENSASNLEINDNIFLNNDGVAISFAKSDITSNADYNWFGHDAANYNIQPVTGNVEINVWLFLNATLNPDVFSFSDTSNVTFKLYAYDSNKVSEYDYNRLKEVNLTITPVNGQINVTWVNIGGTVHYGSNGFTKDNLTATIENVVYTKQLRIADGTTFWDLNNTINGNGESTITLDKNYTYNPLTDYNFKNGIVIDREMTIVGNNYTLNANGKARIFNIKANNVIIKNITFINANTTENGAVYWGGADGTVSDCSFVNNSAKYGGAVYWNGADGVVSGCSFVNNSAGSGGSVYWGGADGVVSGCSFVNGNATMGGAIAWDSTNGNVSGCSFVNNSARYGGVVYWNGADGVVFDCSFVNNSAGSGGGVVYWNGADGVVSDCSFVNSSAGSGGSVYWGGADGVVSGCSFVNNSATMGGAISVYGNGAVSGCNFTNNNASYGGAIMLFGNGVVSDCSFVNNSANSGGAILLDGTDSKVSDCSFVNNSANSGGAILLDGTDSKVSDCSFVNNSASYGGAVYCDSANGVVSGCSFENNYANRDGGAIFWNECNNGNVSGCSFVNNSATIGGAVYWDRGDDGVVSDCSFVNNTARRDGGAILWCLSIGGAVSGCNFVNNSASTGGAVYWDRSSNGVVSYCIFVNNSASNGIIYFYNMANSAHNLTTNNNIFLNNKAYAIFYSLPDILSNADYNWFGNNADNYYIKPIVNNAIINFWLFLNATANPDSILIYESTDVLFKIYSFNSTAVSDYDNSQLYPINLTITATHGDVDVTVAKLGQTIRYDATSVGNGTITAKIENAEYTIKMINIKADPILSVESLEVIYSNSTAVKLRYNSAATGKVNVILTGKKSNYTFTDLELNETVLLGDIDVDEYSVSVNYSGDDIFINSTAAGTLKVNKANSTIDVVNIEFNYEGYVIATVITDGAKSIVAEIDDGDIKLFNNVILISGLDAGNHTLTVTTVPDDNHYATTKTVIIDSGGSHIKENTTIALEVSSIEDNATFTVNVNSDATGIVKFEVSGAENYTVYADVLNGVAVMEDVLSVGDYSVVATYMGDDRFNSNFTSKKFTIRGHIKKDTPISADAKVNGNLVTIIVNVNNDATGFVRLKQSDSTIYVALDGGVATYAVKLAVGSYNVDVTYIGDDNYNENSTRITFTVVEVTKDNTPIGLEVSGVNNNVTFTVNLDPDATGIVRFEVSGAEEYTVYADVINGKAIMEDVLSVGDYTVVATYMGDSRFNSNITSESFTVKGHVKKDTPISADAKVNGNLVTITVNVNNDATGFVKLKQSDSTIYVALDGGVATYAVKLAVGSYNVDVTYIGDDNYNENSTRITFTVVEAAKKNTPISLKVSGIGNNVTFAVDLDSDATGIVRFEVSGAENYTVYADVVGGKAVMDDVLSVGDYTVVATYMGDDIFNSNITSESFTVSGHVKRDTPITAGARVNGNRVTITVNVDGDATGFVGLTQSGSTIYIELKGGVATYVSTYDVGSYNVKVNYIGDDNFNKNSTMVLFTVVEAAKKNTPIFLKVSGIENNVTFAVDLDSDATGIVRFEVSGAENYTVYADVLNGVAIMDDVLEEGDYTVVATYMGDDRFNSNITSQSFTVKGHVKKNTPISAVAKVNGNMVTITVNVDADATGFAEFKMNGSSVYLPVKGGKTILNSNFELGSHKIVVNYLGDEEFNANSTSIEFTVSNIKTQIIAPNVKTIYGVNKNIVITLTDVKGNLLIGKKITVKFNKRTYVKTTNSKGQIAIAIGSNLVPKTYTASISFAGDSSYLKSTKSVKVIVAKRTPVVGAKSKVFNKKVKTKVYTATLKYNGKAVKGVKMVLKFKNKKYFAKVGSNGKATFKITHLTKKARYTGLVGFLGNKYYNKAKSVRVLITVR